MEENDLNDIEKKQAAFVADLLERGKQRNIENRNSIIGYNIKKHRKRQRLTQEQLGKRIGKTTSSIQKYEAGKTEIPRSVLEDIASALNLHLLDKEQSQRTIDFVCGAAHALNGKPQKVGDLVFVFTPSNVTLSVDIKTNQNKFNDSLWRAPLQ